jgi:uracil DNA glycosylase superfamily protein
MTQYCPSCASQICPPSGRSQDILVIGEFPGRLEMERQTPFATHTQFVTAGKVFRKELERVGVSLNDFRCLNLWLHEPTKDEGCFKAGYEHVLDEAKGKKAILLVGSDVVETFTEYKVSDVSGLQVDSVVLSAPIIYAIVNPALALHRAVGEVRFGIEKFVGRLQEEGLL